MKRIILLTLFTLACIAVSRAQTIGGFSFTPGQPVAVTGDILLVDGASLILQTDGTSAICIAGGC